MKEYVLFVLKYFIWLIITSTKAKIIPIRRMKVVMFLKIESKYYVILATELI